MAGKRSVVVGGIEFASKAALERHCRGIISKCCDGELMPESEFMLNLIRERHCTPWEKIIPGLEDQIVGVRVRHESARALIDHGKQNHTFVAYATGHEIDFSWPQCCKGFSVRSWSNAAMRKAIEPDVVAYKKMRFLSGSVTSDASGVPLTWDECAVDHYPVTYWELRDRFLSHKGIALDEVETVNAPRGGSLLGDEEFSKEWVLFHKANAKLRLVTPEENKRSWKEPERHGHAIAMH